MSARHPAPNLPAATLTTVWQSASLLLGYPDERLLDDLPLLRSAARSLPVQSFAFWRSSVVSTVP